MAKDSLTQQKPDDQFAGKVLQNVPRVGFYGGGNRCPESFTFSSCLAAILQHLGEDRGIHEIDLHGQKWLLNSTYVYLMGTSGEAFRLFWKPGWYMDNTGMLSFTEDSRRFIDQAFVAIGRTYRLLFQADSRSDETAFRRGIVHSIRKEGRPVLAFGVVGPPEGTIVTGFDQDGEVLLGWSFFQDQSEHAVGVDFEPCGYFRKRQWYKDTHAIVLIGDKQDAPPVRQIYPQALRWAVDLIRRPTIDFNGERPSGLAAYEVWAHAIQQDDDFPAEEMDILRQRHLVQTSSVGMVAEGRWYASHFLGKIIKDVPECSEPLQSAVTCFEQEHQLMWEIWGLMGGIGFSDENVLQLADPANRRQMVPLILQARDLDAQAAECMEQAISVLEGGKN